MIVMSTVVADVNLFRANEGLLLIKVCLESQGQFCDDSNDEQPTNKRALSQNQPGWVLDRLFDFT